MRNDIYPPTLASAGLTIAVVSFLALAGAWALQLLGGFEPCPLCLEQRIAYYIAVPGGIVAAMIAGNSPRVSAIILALCGVALLYNAGLGVYHAGAEWKFWPGPATCAGAQELSRSPADLIRSLQNNTQTVRCDEAALRVLGVSLAGYSALISTVLALVTAVALVRYLRSGVSGPRPAEMGR